MSRTRGIVACDFAFPPLAIERAQLVGHFFDAMQARRGSNPRRCVCPTRIPRLRCRRSSSSSFRGFLAIPLAPSHPQLCQDARCLLLQPLLPPTVRAMPRQPLSALLNRLVVLRLPRMNSRSDESKIGDWIWRARCRSGSSRRAAIPPCFGVSSSGSRPKIARATTRSMNSSPTKSGPRQKRRTCTFNACWTQTSLVLAR
jgi:hypothetical protein